MARHQNGDWTLPERLQAWDQAAVAVLMDLRDELQRLNALLHCSNAQDIPNILRRIDANTKRKPRKQVRRGR